LNYLSTLLYILTDFPGFT